MPAANSFLGVGWRWPLDVAATGSFAMVDGVEQLEQAIYLVLSTEPGDRPMRPEFGCRLRQFVFAPGNATTAGLIAAEARAALTRWEPRIAVDDIAVSSDADDPSVLWVDVRFTVRASNDRRNLVFPFYVIPSHEEPALASGTGQAAGSLAGTGGSNGHDEGYRWGTGDAPSGRPSNGYRGHAANRVGGGA